MSTNQQGSRGSLPHPKFAETYARDGNGKPRHKLQQTWVLEKCDFPTDLG